MNLGFMAELFELVENCAIVDVLWKDYGLTGNENDDWPKYITMKTFVQTPPCKQIKWFSWN